MEMAGHICLGHCEIDNYANMSYAAMHKIKEGEWFGTDINEVRAEELPKVQVWCFGFPCQDISIAGRKLGFTGQRSSLFFSVTRLISELKEEDKPVYLFIENVKNLLGINGGTDFLKLLIELDKIGYDPEWEVLNSKWFGVPQNRERVYVVGHLRGKSGQKIFPIGGVQTGGQIKIKKDIWIKFKNRDIKNRVSIIQYLRDNKHKTNTAIASETGITLTQLEHYFRLDSSGAVPNGEDWLKLKKCLGFDYTYDKELTTYFDDYYKYDMSGRLYEINGISPTLTTINGLSQVPFINTPEGIRRLTAREFFRLQGWPDDYFDRANKVCPEKYLYKQAGNSVTVNVIYEIAKRLV